MTVTNAEIFAEFRRVKCTILKLEGLTAAFGESLPVRRRVALLFDSERRKVLGLHPAMLACIDAPEFKDAMMELFGTELFKGTIARARQVAAEEPNKRESKRLKEWADWLEKALR
jgi:hypothetical protein